MNFFSKRLDNYVQAHLLSYLEPKDIIQLREISKNTKRHLDSPEIDIMWQPFINRLNVMDPPISSPNSKTDRPLYHCFKNGFAKINKRQMFEIKHFEGHFKQCEAHLWGEHAAFLHYVTYKLNTFKDPAKTLKELEARELFLNNVNEQIIRNAIKITPENHSSLSISHILTRFPNSLFKDAELNEYWAKLKGIDCSFNHLQTLPGSLGQCTQLTTLICSYNQLQELPESLKQCANLRTLNYRSNFLSNLHTFFKKIDKLHLLQEDHRPDALMELQASDNTVHSSPSHESSPHAAGEKRKRENDNIHETENEDKGVYNEYNDSEELKKSFKKHRKR